MKGNGGSFHILVLNQYPRHILILHFCICYVVDMISFSQLEIRSIFKFVDYTANYVFKISLNINKKIIQKNINLLFYFLRYCIRNSIKYKCEMTSCSTSKGSPFSATSKTSQFANRTADSTSSFSEKYKCIAGKVR